jgi:hypothetical protein
MKTTTSMPRPPPSPGRCSRFGSRMIIVSMTRAIAACRTRLMARTKRFLKENLELYIRREAEGGEVQGLSHETTGDEKQGSSSTYASTSASNSSMTQSIRRRLERREYASSKSNAAHRTLRREGVGYVSYRGRSIHTDYIHCTSPIS